MSKRHRLDDADGDDVRCRATQPFDIIYSYASGTAPVSSLGSSRSELQLKEEQDQATPRRDNLFSSFSEKRIFREVVDELMESNNRGIQSSFAAPGVVALRSVL